MNMKKLLVSSLMAFSMPVFAESAVAGDVAADGTGGMQFFVGAHVGAATGSITDISTEGMPETALQQSDFNGTFDTAATVLMPATDSVNLTVDYNHLSPSFGGTGVTGGINFGVTCSDGTWVTSFTVAGSWRGDVEGNFNVNVTENAVYTVADITPATATVAASAPAQTSLPYTMANAYDITGSIRSMFVVDVIVGLGMKVGKFVPGIAAGYSCASTKLILPVYVDGEMTEESKKRAFHGFYLGLNLAWELSDSVALTTSFAKRFFVAREFDLSDMELNSGDTATVTMPSNVTYSDHLPMTSFPASVKDSAISNPAEDVVTLKTNYMESEFTAGVRFAF